MIQPNLTSLGELQAFLDVAKESGLSDSTPILFGGSVKGVSARAEEVTGEVHLIIDQGGYNPNDNE